MEICSCSLLSYYLITAVTSYVIAHIIQVVLDLPLWEGQQQHHSPSDEHFELKRLIQKILEEIAKLPELLNHSGLPLRPEEHLPYFDPKKYEQLVATAVLNKVVDDYRNPKNFINAGDVAAKPYAVGGGAVDLNHNQLTEGGGSHHSGALDAETLRLMSLTADDSHAHEAATATFSATGDRRLSDTDESYLSDYIQRHKVPLPDLSDTTTGSGSGAEDDDLQSLKSNATDGTWEENWLFRKRQLKTTESSIAMLVPSPTEEVKALIGDKNADEISDLSEAGSDCEGYESDGNVAPVSVVSKGELNSPPTWSSSKDETSEGLSSSSKPKDSLEEEAYPADSLVSISSLPGNEEPLSEAKNSQLLAKQEQPVPSVGSLLEDLVSIEAVAEKIETTNPTLAIPFFSDPFEVNNSVITDDVKLLQRTEASDNRSTTAEPCTNGHGDRKEVPIDRADPQQTQQPPQQRHHTHSNIYPSNPVADSVVEPVASGENHPSRSVLADSATGSGARTTNLTNNEENTNRAERLNPQVPQLLLFDSLSPPGSPVQQVLSPHPILMTITDVFDRMASSSPLAAISEELPPAMLLDSDDADPAGFGPLEGSIDQSCSLLSTILEELPPTILLDTGDEDVPLLDTSLDTDADQIETPMELPLANVVSLDDQTFGEPIEGSSNADVRSEIHQEPIESISKELPQTASQMSLDELYDSEADQEPMQMASAAVLSPMDSFQDDSEYRTVSDGTHHSLTLVESFEELDPFGSVDMPHDHDSLERCEEEFSSLVEESGFDAAAVEDTLESTVTTQSSPELLQIRETPPVAIYVPNQNQRETAEQLKALEEPSINVTPQHDLFEEEDEDDDKTAQITLHADLVTFDNNAPSPERNPGIVAVTEQMRAYCEELKSILNRPSTEDGQEKEPFEELSDPWEMIEPTEALEALTVFREEWEEEPTAADVRPCKDHPIREAPVVEPDEPFASVLEVGRIRTAEYSDSLKNIEHVEEAIAMDEQVQTLPDSTIEMEEGSSEVLYVSSPEPSHCIVAVNHTPSTEDPPSQIGSESDVVSIADEAAESSGTSPTQTTAEEAGMLASIESRSESKIEDTSMPFSDCDLPSLSSPFTSTIVPTGNTTTTTVINNCMPTNITDQEPTPSISASTIDTDTNPSNNTRSACDLSPDGPRSVDELSPIRNVADCSIIPAQSTAEQQTTDEPELEERNQQSLEEADTLIPGSIAEREHLKWRNAKPIANNPYSPDALQRRLSEKSRPSSMIELDRLVKKDAVPNGAAVVLLDDEQHAREPVDSGTENDRSLQSVMGGGLSEKKKIGREYYINDPERLRTGDVLKQTLGVEQKQQQQQQLSHSTDDEKSLLLGRNVEDNEPNRENVDTHVGACLSRSNSFGKARDANAEDIFVARPIQVTADDPILRKGTKVNYLSTAAREIFLVPLEPEPHGSLLSSSSEVSINSPSSSGARPELDSLTYSEDSDVTRIYDLTTGEAKVIRSGAPIATDTILEILPQQPSPVKGVPASPTSGPSPVPVPMSPRALSPSICGQDERVYLRPGQFMVKPLSPETIKFFAPKRKLSFTGSSTNLTASDTAKVGATGASGQTMHSSLHIDFPASRAAHGSEFSIIEKDVMDVLPSVKELAKCYSGSCTEVSSMPPKPLYKPRDFLRQSSDVLSEEVSGSLTDAGTMGQRKYSSTSSIAVREEIREIRKINLEAYRQQSTFYPMAPGHSITARSLSKQIREHKTNVTDDHKVGQHEELPGSNGSGGDGGGNGGGGGDAEVITGHASPERPCSPVFLPGHLKSSIDFFESLRNNK